jgi:steroid 5-alpha reductase family enzyme
MPTIVVYLGCLSLYAALSTGARPLNWVDGTALLITGGAIWVEAQADRELWWHRSAEHPPGSPLHTGLWKVFRHPNYLGEMTFWWGLWLFALAADPGAWWTIVGPLAVTVLFLTVSIPMMERHLQERRTK